MSLTRDYVCAWCGDKAGPKCQGTSARKIQPHVPGPDTVRYASWDDALAGHMAMVRRIDAKEHAKP